MATRVEDVYTAIESLEGALTPQTAKLALDAVSSAKSTHLTDREVAVVTKTLGAVSEAAGKDKDSAKEFLNVCGDLLSANYTDALSSSGTATNSSTSASTSVISNLLSAVDNFAASVTENLLDENTTEVLIANDNLVLQCWSDFSGKIKGNKVELTPESSKNVFSLPASSFQGKEIKATAVVFKTLHNAITTEVEGQSSSGNATLGSEVVSLTVTQEDGSPLPFSEDNPVVLSFQLEQSKTSDQEAKCCFWKFQNSSEGGLWSTDGCVVNESSSNATTCHCSHLTNFAVLLQLKETVIPAAHSTALEVLTYIGTILSITSLLLSIGLFCFLRLLKSQRVIIHVNLAVSLAAAQLLYLTGIDATSNQGWCKAIAVLLHYLFTTSFAWMFMEGVHLYMKSVAVFGKGLKTWMHMAIGWGSPLLIVGVALAARFDGYGTETRCWLSLDSGLIYAFVTPVVVVVVLNTLILVMVIRVFMGLKANVDKTEKEKIRAGIRAVLLLQPLLGFTWVFGLFSAFDDTLFFTYLFVIFNSSQGVFIFLLHCVGDYEVRKAFKRYRGRRPAPSPSTDCSAVNHSRLTRKQTEQSMTARAPSTPGSGNKRAPSTPGSGKEAHALSTERKERHLTSQDLNNIRLKRREPSMSITSKSAWAKDNAENKAATTGSKSKNYEIDNGTSCQGMPEVKTDL
ncbi:adhesion G-protein coupled receptor D1-like isoform X2 [Patiria miniata]|uniref:Adhesion G-protein coupled receptor D1-like n=1 Tax=Patiria miniata TaxID=46514 RepID=A0A913ZHD9_PATMI|nr:adhesion G-protein coupled receptor D1-like isoform X2 [Patiria miniata]